MLIKGARKYAPGAGFMKEQPRLTDCSHSKKTRFVNKSSFMNSTRSPPTAVKRLESQLTASRFYERAAAVDRLQSLEETAVRRPKSSFMSITRSPPTTVKRLESQLTAVHPPTPYRVRRQPQSVDPKQNKQCITSVGLHVYMIILILLYK